MKAYPHKSCGCQSCRAGSRTKRGKKALKATERRFRHGLSNQCRSVVSRRMYDEDVLIPLDSNGYTD